MTEVQTLPCPSWHPLMPTLRCDGDLGHGRVHNNRRRPVTFWTDVDPLRNPTLAAQQRWGDD